MTTSEGMWSERKYVPIAWINCQSPGFLKFFLDDSRLVSCLFGDHADGIEVCVSPVNILVYPIICDVVNSDGVFNKYSLWHQTIQATPGDKNSEKSKPTSQAQHQLLATVFNIFASGIPTHIKGSLWKIT